jgi:hypothetical protein
MMPQSVEAQEFLNTADLSWSVVLHSPGDCPPAGRYVARMAADPASLEIDHVFSEARGTLVRGEVDAQTEVIALHFVAPARAVAKFVGPYTLDLLYERDGATIAVMRTTFSFAEGA